jgi:hypothetical protein
MKQLFFLFQPAFFLFIVGACQNSGDSGAVFTGSNGEFEEFLDIPLTEQPPPAPIQEKDIQQISSRNRMLVKSGRLEIESQQLEKDNQHIRKLLPGFNAFVDSEEFSNNDYSSSYRLTIKVPVSQFDSLMDTLAGIGQKTINKSSNAEDVSRQYRDLNATIESKKALESRYRELLSKATQIKDMLEIERNLNDLRNEIEGNEARFRTLQNDINYSTIHLYFFEFHDQNRLEKPSFLNRLANSFQGGWNMFVWLLLALVRLWPLGVLGVLIWSLIIYLKNRKK